MKIQVENKN